MGENLSTFGTFPEDVKLYLRPTALGRAGLDLGLSLPLGAGTVTFSSLELILRNDGRRLYQGTFPVTSLTSLKDQLPEAAAGQFDQVLDHLTSPRQALQFSRGSSLSFAAPLVMGILNITPDSFSDGGDFFDASSVKNRAVEIFKSGADLIDVGAESTRPGASEVPVKEELERLEPLFKVIRDLPGPVSIDTRKAAVMAAGLAAGAGIINDVSALSFDTGAALAANAAPGIVLMHARGDPKTMQDNPEYGDVLLDVYDYLEARIEAAVASGISREKLIIDPGIGFGKTTAHTLELLRGLSLFQGLGCPLLIGVSRKRFLGELTGEKEPKKRLSSGLAAAILAAGQGAHIIRTHDVAEMRHALAVFNEFGQGAG
ncbi:MAG: dihydropteroate synthase [Sphingomonadales bacterium]